ncbi:MAG: phospholipase D-like domain-containing protein [Polyangiaceae bacterium]
MWRINPALSEALPNLVTNDRVPAPPGARPLRTALVRHNVETTYVVPGDWPPMDGTRWLPGRAAPPGGTDVQYLIDGPQTLNAMMDAMRTAETSSHCIVLLGWSLDVYTRMNLDSDPVALSFLQLVEERAALGVAVRVLLWENTLMLSGDDEDNNRLPAGSVARRLNENAKLALEKLRTLKKQDVYCNLDDNTKGWVSGQVASASGNAGVHSYGAHHQKIMLVHGKDGLIGFCGGIDIDPNRRPGGRGGRDHYLHDVHVRVQGSAAEDLWKIAEKRWERAEDNGNPPAPATISVLAPPAFSKPTYAPYLATAVQTVGNPDIAKSTTSTLWPAVKEAIARAGQFIYMEDQYFWSLDLVDELVRASKRLRHITILVPAALTGEQPYKRHAAIGALKARGGDGIEKKITIFESWSRGHSYVHAKLFIMDDEYAIVGTANANNRGYFLDSEAAVCVAERSARNVDGSRLGEWFALEGNFARMLRIQLWREHLSLGPEELFDGVAAHVHWRKIMTDLDRRDPVVAGANVAPYKAINLEKKLQHKLIEEAHWEWEQQKKEAESRGESFYAPEPKTDENAWDDPRKPWNPENDEKPWWKAPFDDWAPRTPKQDSVVDPKD